MARVAADSALLPKPSATTARRGSSPISATLPGPAGVLPSHGAVAVKSCQPSLVPTYPALARPKASCLMLIDGSQRQAERPLLGQQHAARR